MQKMIFLGVIVLTACSTTPEPTTTTEPTATKTAIPTETPKPTSTFTPEPTEEPTATPTPEVKYEISLSSFDAVFTTLRDAIPGIFETGSPYGYDTEPCVDPKNDSFEECVVSINLLGDAQKCSRKTLAVNYLFPGTSLPQRGYLSKPSVLFGECFLLIRGVCAVTDNLLMTEEEIGIFLCTETVASKEDAWWVPIAAWNISIEVERAIKNSGVIVITPRESETLENCLTMYE